MCDIDWEWSAEAAVAVTVALILPSRSHFWKTARVPGKTSRRFPHRDRGSKGHRLRRQSSLNPALWHGPATGQGPGGGARDGALMCEVRLNEFQQKCAGRESRVEAVALGSSAQYLYICICIWTCICICSCSCCCCSCYCCCCCCMWHLLGLVVAQLVLPRQRIKVNHLFAGCPRTDRVHCQVQVSSVYLCVCLCVCESVNLLRLRQICYSREKSGE